MRASVQTNFARRISRGLRISRLERFKKFCGLAVGVANAAVLLTFGFVSAQLQGCSNLRLRRSLAQSQKSSLRKATEFLEKLQVGLSALGRFAVAEPRALPWAGVRPGLWPFQSPFPPPPSCLSCPSCLPPLRLCVSAPRREINFSVCEAGTPFRRGFSGPASAGTGVVSNYTSRSKTVEYKNRIVRFLNGVALFSDRFRVRPNGVTVTSRLFRACARIFPG